MGTLANLIRLPVEDTADKGPSAGNEVGEQSWMLRGPAGETCVAKFVSQGAMLHFLSVVLLLYVGCLPSVSQKVLK